MDILAAPFLALSLALLALGAVAALMRLQATNIPAAAALVGTVGVVIMMLSGCGAKADPCCITYQDYTATMDAPAPTPAATIEASKYQFRP